MNIVINLLLMVVVSLVALYTLFSMKFVGAENATYTIILNKRKRERIEGVFEFKWYTPLILLTSTILFIGCVGLVYNIKPEFLTGNTIYNFLIILFLCCYLVYLLPKVTEAIEFLIAKRKEREILKHDL